MKTTSLKREDMITDIMKYDSSYLEVRLNKLSDIQLLIIKVSAEIEASSEPKRQPRRVL